MAILRNIKENWKASIDDTSKKIYLATGFIALLISFVVSYFAAKFADQKGSSAVSDLILDWIPVIDMGFAFFWIPLFWCVGLLIYHLFVPRQLILLLWAYTLFIMVRAFFITLTHLGPPLDYYLIPDGLSFYSFNADLFFSGHVGGPFLFALLTDNRALRITALIYTLFMIVIVLMGHYHYSIDVFASLFISHSLSVLVLKMSKNDI